MEKNKKDKKKESKSKNEVQALSVLATLFEYDELTVAVLSHLSITELPGLQSVCKKWSAIINDPIIWKGVITSTFGAFLGPEYQNVIKNASAADIKRAVMDPTFASQLFDWQKFFVDGDTARWDPILVAIPTEIKREALYDLLFSDKPIWRSPWLTNLRSAQNYKCFVFPTFRSNLPHPSDTLFTLIFFYSFTIDDSRFMTAKDVWDVIEARAKTSDRSKQVSNNLLIIELTIIIRAIRIICQWITNGFWHVHSKELDPLLEQFLEAATNEERDQIEHSKTLSNTLFDWEKNDRTYMVKLTDELLKDLKVNIKPKLLNQPINIIEIPPHEMAKQIALAEQRSFRTITPELFMNRRWLADNGVIKRFNQISMGLAHWILHQPTVEKRYEASAYLLKVGNELVQMRCASAVLMIHTSLHMASISRLSSVQKAFKKFAKEAEEIIALSSPNAGYKRLREILNNATDLPAVPYLGITLSDLTFISDGNSWQKDGMINFRKAALTVQSICTFLQHQLVPYLYEPLEALQQLWEDFGVEAYNENDMYSLSLALKPRGSDTKETDRPSAKK